MNQKRTSGSRPERGKLRSRAEQRLKTVPITRSSGVDDDPRRLVHELHVHMIELEMQNEELQAVRKDLEMQNEELQAVQKQREATLRRYTQLFDFAPIGYFLLSDDGTIRELNFTGARLLGTQKWALIGRRLGLFVAEGQRRAFADYVSRVARSSPDESESSELELTPQHGRSLDARLLATIVETAPIGLLLAVEDITRRKRAEAAIVDELRRKDALIASLQALGDEAKVAGEGIGSRQDEEDR